ncbi:hypothetical protein BS78_06G064500 [Paspalum vaginatum]|nr:hypothetical protein BS78_06G064500 [Paspalum vaginatum]
MATRGGSCLMTLLLLVSLVLTTGDVINGEQERLAGIGSEGPAAVELGGGKGSSVDPRSRCTEQKLYRGPCIEAACVAACMLSFRQGGHCSSGGFFTKHCLCYACE